MDGSLATKVAWQCFTKFQESENSPIYLTGGTPWDF